MIERYSKDKVSEEGREVVNGVIEAASNGEVGEGVREDVEGAVEVLAHNEMGERRRRREERFGDPTHSCVAKPESGEGRR